MRKRLLLVTGSPGVGKTTVLLKVVEALKAGGYSVGGMISREVRSGGSRVGFEVLDISTGKSGWLAHVDQEVGPQVGKYRVNLEDLDGIGAEAIVKAVENSDIVAVDEIGPMELFSQKFQEAVRRAVESTKVVVCIVHWKARSRLIDEIRIRGDAEVYVVSYGNRESLHELLVGKAVGSLEKTSRE